MYATIQEIREALCRVSEFDTHNPHIKGMPDDGTYTLYWSYRTLRAAGESRHTSAGYEVAYQPVLDGTDLTEITPSIRVGFWFDPETGIEHLDHVVNVLGPGGVALDLARLYNQKAVWHWKTETCIPTTDPATAL